MGSRAAIYTRISKDRLGDEHGVTNQLAECERLAAQRGYEVTARFSDNDISALNGKHRPGYAALMTAVARRELDAILIFQTSRLWRNRAERAAGIKALQGAAVSVIAARGPSLDCSTAQGRAMAGLLGEFDTLESEIKGERQQLANAADARAGRRRTACPRPFGYAADRVTPDPAEGPAVAAAVELVNAGGSLSAVLREWTRAGLRPPQAPSGRWTRSGIRAILLNPAIAGLSVYRGEVIGAGTWAPLVTREAWQACRARLEDPARKPPRGVRTLLGGLALCPCGAPALGSVNHLGTHVYRCLPAGRQSGAGPHVARIAADVDRYVTGMVIARLSREDAADLLPHRDRADVAALSAEANAVRSRRADLAAMFADGELDRAALLAGTARADARLAEIEGRLAEAASDSAVAPLLGAGDMRAAWEALDLSRQRAVIAALLRVHLGSPGRGRRSFDPDSVRVEWLAA